MEFEFTKYPIGSKWFPEPESVNFSHQASAIQQLKHYNIAFTSKNVSATSRSESEDTLVSERIFDAMIVLRSDKCRNEELIQKSFNKRKKEKAHHCSLKQPAVGDSRWHACPSPPPHIH